MSEKNSEQHQNAKSVQNKDARALGEAEASPSRGQENRKSAEASTSKMSESAQNRQQQKKKGNVCEMTDSIQNMPSTSTSTSTPVFN